MEVKCKVCGAINDGETNFCKECFVKLDVENPENVTYNPKEKELPVEIEEEKDITPWSDETIEKNKPISNLNNEIIEKNLFNQNKEFEPITFEQENNLTLDNEPIQQIQSENNEFKPIDELSQNEEIEKTEIIDFDLIKDTYNNSKNNSEEKYSLQSIESSEKSKDNISSETLLKQEELDLPKVELFPNEINTNEENSIPEISNNLDNGLPDLDMDQFNSENDLLEDEKIDINYVSSKKLFLKFFLNCLLFGIVFGTICLGFRYLLSNIFNLENNAELIFIVISSVSSIATLLIATDKTFKKQVPLASKINETTFLILFFIALPYLLIKLAYNLFVGTTFVVFLILIALSLIILAIFFNYMRNIIRMKHQMKKEDKTSFIYGIFSIVLIGITLFGVYIYKEKDYNISFDILFNDGENIKLVESYISEVEKSISKNKNEIEGYEIPNIIENVEYAAYDGKKPDGMVLYIDENGKVSSGTILIKNKEYLYDGEKVRVN